MKSFSFSFLICALSCLMFSVPARGTNFAILLGGCGSGGTNDKCNDDGDYLEVPNPLYQQSGNSGDNPLFEGKTDLLMFKPIQFASEADVLFSVSFGNSISTKVPPVPGGSLVFEVNITDANTHERLTSFPQGVDIQFNVPALDHLHQEGVIHRDLAFRYLNTSVSPPVWEVMPSGVATKDGNFCGKTDHFSIFAFGAVPEPSSVVLLLVGGVGMCWRRKE